MLEGGYLHWVSFGQRTNSRSLLEVGLAALAARRFALVLKYTAKASNRCLSFFVIWIGTRAERRLWRQDRRCASW